MGDHPNPFMSRKDVEGYTRSHTKAGQCLMLRSNGIRHTIDLHGWPVVLWSAVEGGDTAQAAAKAWKPNKAA